MISVEQEQVKNKTSSLLKSVIAESKKIRTERGEDFFDTKKIVPVNIEKLTSQIQTPSGKNSENDYRSLRDSHVKLANIIVQYDKKIFEQNAQVLNPKKARSKSVHLYIDEKIEHFLNIESKKKETHWRLRKNAGLGSLISKFIENFMELKKREEKQLKHIKKIIEDFRSNLVAFKKYSSNANDYLNAESANQKMKAQSSDLQILLSLLEFEDEFLKKCLGTDSYTWVDFIIKWKFHS
jgi:hypothetical protein